MSPVKRLEQARRGVQVTRWLRARGFPATAPLDIAQPIQVEDCVVTFWRYYDYGRHRPPPTALAHLLRQLHGFEPPPYPLPTYEPLVSFRDELKAYGSRVLSVAEYDFLHDRAEELVRAYRGLTSALGSGLIHGDARVVIRSDRARAGAVPVGLLQHRLAVVCPGPSRELGSWWRSGCAATFYSLT
jgi:hypothetical protein